MSSEKEEKEKLYAISYDLRIEEKPLTEKEIKASKRGGCDSIFLVSILHLDGQESMLEGATSSATIGLCGPEDRYLNSAEKFQIWTTLTSELCEELPEGDRKDLCTEVLSIIRMMIKKTIERKGEN